MAEYIDRKALLDELCRDNCERTYDGTCHNCRMTDTIADFPAADVAEVRHGRWEEVDWIEFDVHGLEATRIPKAGLRCSRCSNVFKKELLWKDNYCPNCGACMDKEDEK